MSASDRGSRHPPSVAPVEGEPLGGRYELVQTLGIGSLSTVYRAMDRRLAVPRAVKVLHPFATADGVALERFLDEVRTLARLEHPNVLRIFDFGRDQGRYFAVFELADRGGVQRLIDQGGALPPNRALRIAFQVSSALASAHLHSVIHRDVRPANVLIGLDGNARLADFGVARLRHRVTELSETDIALGATEYTAPELRSDFSDADACADVWSVGAVLLFLLTARVPSWPHPVISDDLPTFTARVLRGSLAFDRAHRYPSADWLAREIAAAYDGYAASVGLPLRGDAWVEWMDEQLAVARQAVGTAAQR